MDGCGKKILPAVDIGYLGSGTALADQRGIIPALPIRDILLHHKLNPLLHCPDIHQNTSSR